jgi:cyclohexyl-isocyanide hydratase
VDVEFNVAAVVGKPAVACDENIWRMVLMAKNPLQVGMLCYPRLTQLDLTGPYEVLCRMPDTQVHVLWKDTTPVKAEGGLCIVPNRNLGESPNMDVVLVPGGLGQQDLMEDDEVLSFLMEQAETARYMVSVCTGSLLLAAAGLLRGYRATCHWLFLPLLEPLGAIPIRERVVIDRDRVTAAGVSAGIDCGLQLAALLGGRQVAEAIQLQIEYDPEPPFSCGSVNTAPESLVRRLTEASEATLAARCSTAHRLSKNGATMRNSSD